MTESVKLDTVDEAIAEIAAGKPVVVVDDEDRENEGDIIFAAEKATPELMGFLVRYSSGSSAPRSLEQTAIDCSFRRWFRTTRTCAALPTLLSLIHI